MSHGRPIEESKECGIEWRFGENARLNTLMIGNEKGFTGELHDKSVSKGQSLAVRGFQRTEQTVTVVFHRVVSRRVLGPFTYVLTYGLLALGFGNTRMNRSRVLGYLLFLDSSTFFLCIQSLDPLALVTGTRAKGTHNQSSNEKLLGESTSGTDHKRQLFLGRHVHPFHEHGRHLCKVLLERPVLVVELLMVHVVGPIEETTWLNLGQDLGAREELDDLLLQDGQDVVLGQAHQFFELSKAFVRGGLCFAQHEFILVQELEHLLKGDGIVAHKNHCILLRGTLVCFGFIDLFCELGRALEDRLVGVELGAVRTELDDEDRGREVPVVA